MYLIWTVSLFSLANGFLFAYFKCYFVFPDVKTTPESRRKNKCKENYHRKLKDQFFSYFETRVVRYAYKIIMYLHAQRNTKFHYNLWIDNILSRSFRPESFNPCYQWNIYRRAYDFHNNILVNSRKFITAFLLV